MNLSSLIKHTAHLLRIVNKSNKPADSIIHNYFREKRYIGSKERRFISELVFTTLRYLRLIQYLSHQVLFGEKSKQIIKEQEKVLSYYVIISLILSDLISPETDSFKFSLLYEKIQKNLNDFQNELSGVLSNIFTDLNGVNLRNIIKIELQNLYEIAVNIVTSVSKPSDRDFEILSYRYSIPAFILKSFYQNGIHKENLQLISETAESLMMPAKLKLRVNNLKSDRIEILKSLLNQGIEAELTIFSPDGIIINQRLNLYELNEFKSGLIEIQDEGSQLISFCLSPAENSTILDACAGAGGKSLHMAAITKNNAKILSLDINSQKLNELNKRAKRANAICIETMQQKSFEKMQNSKNKMLFEYVLIDAPCSGLGTIKRSPWLKYHITPKSIQNRQKRQLEILGYYSQFVKPGGILLYSTCSLMPEENEIVIEKFLNKYPEFSPDPVYPQLLKYGIKIPYINKNDFMMSILPSVLNCDGFFVARIRKN